MPIRSAVALGALVVSMIHVPVTPAAAQAIDDAALTRIRSQLSAGDRVGIMDANHGRTSGVVVAFESTRITVRTSTGVREFEMPQVLEISRRGDRWWDAPLVAALAGGAIGYMTGASDCGSEFICLDFRGALALLGASIGGGIGLAADLAHKGSRTIYRAEPTRTRSFDVAFSATSAEARLSWRLP